MSDNSMTVMAKAIKIVDSCSTFQHCLTAKEWLDLLYKTGAHGRIAYDAVIDKWCDKYKALHPRPWVAVDELCGLLPLQKLPRHIQCCKG